jgi:hypothetical protein
METKYSIHYHVWTEMEMIEMFVRLRERFHLSLEPELRLKSNGEAVWILSISA